MAGRHLGTSARGRRALSKATGRAGIAVLLAAVIAAICTAAFAADGRLQPLCIDPTGISVSGISSGGFIANQFHVAHSARVMGAGIFAAGPYLCAGSDYPESLSRALAVCSHFGPGPFLGPPDARRSIAAIRAGAASHVIDDPANLRSDNVFLFSGRLDTLVPTSVMDALATVYRAFVDERHIAYVTDIDSAHAMVTTAFGNACDTSKAPFVNRCGYDLACAALRHIYGPLAPPTEADGKLAVFDQTEFVDPAKTHGLAERGYEYVPKGCTEHRGCRLHVAFHGCLQNADAVGDAFYGHAGYNEWAEANAGNAAVSGSSAPGSSCAPASGG